MADTFHQRYNAWLERYRADQSRAHQERMAVWDYMKTEEYQSQVREQIRREAHADIRPPWEVDETGEEDDDATEHQGDA